MFEETIRTLKKLGDEGAAVPISGDDDNYFDRECPALARVFSSVQSVDGRLERQGQGRRGLLSVLRPRRRCPEVVDSDTAQPRSGSSSRNYPSDNW